MDENDAITEVTVTTTEPLEKKFEDDIVKNIGEKLKKKIRLNKLIDPDLIGGIIIKIDSVMIDNSIKTKLLDYNFNAIIRKKLYSMQILRKNFLSLNYRLIDNLY